MADISDWRVERGENSRLIWAFVISLALHLTVFGTYKAGQEFGWWVNLQWPSWLQRPKLLTELLKKEQPPPPPEREIPLMFVDVNSAQATEEPPKDAQYYSARNSIAANPEPDTDTKVPEITGQQTEIVRTEDVPRERATPLQPTPPPPVTEPKPAEEELKPKPPEPIGDLALAKPDPPKPADETGIDIQSKPRRLTEVARVTPPKSLSGEKMKQEVE